MPGKPIHGFSGTPLYNVWQGIVARCCRPSHPQYKRYGGRGIQICKLWRHNPAAFCKWAIAHGYKKGLQIDRVNNDKGYFPDNCRFVTAAVNLCNTSRNRRLYLNGVSKTVAEWARELGISYSCLRNRMAHGWGDEAVLTTPVNKHFRRLSTPRIIVFRGERHTVYKWAKITGLSAGAIHSRLLRGWAPEKALTTPQKKQSPKRLVCLGKKHTITEWSKITGLDRWVIKQRLSHGWSPEKALATRKTEPKTLAFRGESHTISEWAKITGLVAETIRSRLKRGWPPEMALATTADSTRRMHSLPEMVAFRGERHSFFEWAKITGLNVYAIRSRLKRGWSPEMALTTPVDPKFRRQGKRRWENDG